MYMVSIPSSGSIQFLHNLLGFKYHTREESLNPLKRVNSILTEMSALPELTELRKSQSPQAGQFNSYRKRDFGKMIILKKEVSIPSSGSIQFLLNGLLNLSIEKIFHVSIPSSGSIQFLPRLKTSALTLK